MRPVFFIAFSLFLAACSKSSSPSTGGQQGGGQQGNGQSNTGAYLQVKGRYLTDANGDNALLRGVNVDTYKEGWDDDVDAVATAVATTKANVVRLAWWSHIAGSPEP